ncbi:MAG: carboxypeptidase-like regulatory domain-containing protein [Saprospiraceae bacterium]|nr:carboxypeptidase-like regulatory domain-containing protein [Saprospiraceae bacterium]
MKGLKKLLNYGRNGTLLILAFLLPYLGQSSASIPNKFQMEKLIAILDQISEKYQVIFSYETELLRSIEVDFTLKEESLESAIDRLLSSTGFQYESIGDKYFVIYKNDQQGNRTKRKLSQKIKQIQKIESQGSLRLESYSKKKVDRLRSVVAAVSELRDIEITGRVTSEEGLPLIGVNVTVKNSTTGSSTDIDGYYTLSVPENTQTLVFSYIGFRTTEVDIAGQSTINLT